VREKLSRISRANVQALSIVLDTNGGSPVLADIMTHDLKTFCEERDIKLYTFIEERATAGAVIPISISDRVYALNSSVIGRFGPEASQLRLGTDLGLKTWTSEGGQ
jgi:ClpP class serine protease